MTDQKTSSESLKTGISEQLTRICIAVCTLATESENQAAIASVASAYEQLEKLFLKHQKLTEQTLCGACNNLLKLALKRILRIDRRLINIILISVNLLEKLSSDAILGKDPQFIALAEKNTAAFKDLFRAYIKGENGREEGGFIRLGDVLVKAQVITEKQIEDALKLQKNKYKNVRLGEILIRENLVHARDIIRAIRHQEDIHQHRAEALDDEESAFADTQISRLSALLEELIMAQTLLEQHTASDENNEVVRNVHRLSKGIGELQAFAMDLKTKSLSDVFDALFLLGEEKAAELGLSVDFNISGGETKVDRLVARTLFKPLAGLIDNALLHGLEKEYQRIDANKSPVGNLHISAVDNRGSVLIEVSDDGRGLDFEKILQHAIEAKIADPKKSYSNSELAEFLFHPRYHAESEIGETGLATLKKQLADAGGSLKFLNSDGPGCGFAIEMPLNLAVVAGSIARIGETRYIIPTDNIVKIFAPEDHQWISVGGEKRSLKDKDRIIPVAAAHNLFGLAPKTRFPLIVVLELNGKLLGLPGHEIIGERNNVIRRFRHNLWEHRLITGACVLGDGNIALMLNLQALFDTVKQPDQPAGSA